MAQQRQKNSSRNCKLASLPCRGRWPSWATTWCERAQGDLFNTCCLTHHLPPVELHRSVAHSVWPAMLPVARDYLNRLHQDERFSGNFAPCLKALGEHLNAASRSIAQLG